MTWTVCLFLGSFLAVQVWYQFVKPHIMVMQTGKKTNYNEIKDRIRLFLYWEICLMFMDNLGRMTVTPVNKVHHQCHIHPILVPQPEIRSSCPSSNKMQTIFINNSWFMLWTKYTEGEQKKWGFMISENTVTNRRRKGIPEL